MPAPSSRCSTWAASWPRPGADSGNEQRLFIHLL
jgi:hypothetical protein